jgi:hypothetical protein
MSDMPRPAARPADRDRPAVGQHRGLALVTTMISLSDSQLQIVMQAAAWRSLRMCA